jgi:hypothetical protein
MVLLDLATEKYFGLDEVGATIVTRLTEQPLEQGLSGLALDYEIDVEVLRQEVETFLGSLVEAGLLSRLES